MAPIPVPLLVALALTVPFLAGPPAASPPLVASDAPDTARVVFVGNNWEGTADVVRFDADAGTLTHVGRLNIVPDRHERMLEIAQDPERLGYFLGIRMLVGEGNDQFVDDMYSTPDGKLLVVSRPSLRDVIGLDIESGEIAWRFVVDGQRSDHMGLSPDGTRVAVSASTGNVVHVLDTRTGVEVGRFASGDSPHENTYSADGARIFHASIGLVYTPADRPVADASKGARYFQVVDAATMEILSRVDMGQKLAEAGHEGMSGAVRPMAISPDETTAYLQVSFFHGFVVYDLVNEQVVDVVPLPDLVPGTPRELYLLDSAHHGIAIDAAGEKLCVAGTMSDYAAVVPVDDPGNFTLLQKEEGAKPYWSTTTDDGAHCLLSWSGTDRVSVVSYETGEEVASIEVGDHPQRVRTGHVERAWLEARLA